MKPTQVKMKETSKPPISKPTNEKSKHLPQKEDVYESKKM